jgi:hypothetical protein
MSERSYITSNVIEYNNVRKISGFTCVVKNEDENNFYKKEFRYSVDKILWSDYKELTNKNLSKLSIPETGTFYIEYRFTKYGSEDVELSVESISLDVEYIGNNTSPIPACYWNTPAGLGTGGNCCKPQIIYNCECGNRNMFNPYALGNSLSIYQQMCQLVSNMFGICCQYFKTGADERSRDVVLKEYSLESVIDKRSIKVLIPDNQLPTREIQFNSMMMDYPVQFEVHIVKQEFWNSFGEGTHPDPHDYLYFQAYLNKMYRVDSVSESDDFGYLGAYWRVSLTPYEQMSSVGFADDELKEDTETLIFSAEGKFEDEMKVEYDDNRKDNQLNDIGDLTEGQDWLRRKLDPNIRIVDEKIFNGYTMVASKHYDMTTVDKNLVTVEYKYTEGFTSDDTRMISFFFRPRFTDKNISDNIRIKAIENNEGGIRLRLMGWDNNIVEGNYLMITRAGNANGYRRITFTKKSGYIVDVEGDYDEGCVIQNDCAKVIAHDVNEMFDIRNDEGKLLSIEQTPDNIIMRLNGQRYEYNFNFEGFEDKWYIFLLGMSKGYSNIWLYEVTGSEKTENTKSKFKLISTATNDTGSFDLGETCYYDLVSSHYNITNFRLWNKLCEESMHNIILSQYIIDDTHNTLIVDNAQNELLLNNKWS